MEDIQGAVTYALYSPDNTIVAMVSLANDSVEAYQSSGPAVKILAFGVSVNYQNRGIGRSIMQFLQAFFVIRNKTGCRYFTVSAYNTPDTLRFYLEHCKFISLDLPGEKTAPLFYDLLITKRVLYQNPSNLKYYTDAIDLMMSTGETQIDMPEKSSIG